MSIWPTITPLFSCVVNPQLKPQLSHQNELNGLQSTFLAGHKKRPCEGLFLVHSVRCKPYSARLCAILYTLLNAAFKCPLVPV